MPSWVESSCLDSGYWWGAEFVLHRGEHAQRGVPALSIVEDFQVLEERDAQLQPGPPPSAVEQFDLNPGPEGFPERIESWHVRLPTLLSFRALPPDLGHTRHWILRI